MNPRLFIAFEVPQSEILVREFENIRPVFLHEKISWVRLSQLHITLKFLGETPENRIDAVKEAMSESFSEQKKVLFTLESLGVFGSSYAPKVLWSHVKPEEQCRLWFDLLKKHLLQCGFEYDRQNFVPHLTLARIKSLSDRRSLTETVERYQNFCFSEFGVNKIVLFESILRSSGAEYIRRFSVDLH
jgi:RNA 2',3'-cyclic 3'-phosphodiesterase